MATREMLKFGYKLGQGLGTIGRGSPTLIELLNNKGRFGLGFDPTYEELFLSSRGKKRKCSIWGMSIPHIRTTFLSLAEVIMPKPFKKSEDEDPNLACIIRPCPKELSMNSITSFEDDPTFTIRPGMPDEIVGL